MKVRLSVGEELYEELSQALIRGGFELDDEAELVLIETDKSLKYLPVRNADGNRVHIAADEVIWIESYGHSVTIHTAEGLYQSGDRIYRLCLLLDPKQFLRISNSVIIQRNKVKKIIPSLSMKFILVMADGAKVDVTRTYYNSFKEFFGL